MAATLLSERTWMRHANPWSVWSRYAAFPFLVASIFSAHWIGWAALIPVATTVGFLYINPWLFPPPHTTRSWASKAVLGERVWLAEGRLLPADMHPWMIPALMIVSVINLAALIWGIVRSDPVLTGVTTINVLVAKSWFNDRMVWLFTERARDNPEYRSWLY